MTVPNATSTPPKPRAGQEITLTIDRLAYGGQGVGRANGLAVFTNGTAPGEQVRARLNLVRRRHAEADVAAIVEPSPRRVPPRCPHVAQGCGGCGWQHLDQHPACRQ